MGRVFKVFFLEGLPWSRRGKPAAPLLLSALMQTRSSCLGLCCNCFMVPPLLLPPQVLRQYTNAAATVTSELLTFTTKFAVQVGALAQRECVCVCCRAGGGGINGPQWPLRCCHAAHLHACTSESSQ